MLCLTVGCCVVLGRRGLGLAWSARSLSCLVGEVLVLRIGRQGLGSAFWSAWVTEWVFFFFFLNMGFWWAMGNGDVVGVLVVTG